MTYLIHQVIFCLIITLLHTIVTPDYLSYTTQFDQSPALITFDDGFKGTFENGLKILSENKLPSIIFLNMHNILSKEPLISAITGYLDNYSKNYNHFLELNNIEKPSHLYIKPKNLKSFIKHYGEIDYNKINKYQGQFADITLLKKWANEKNVFYGNHLFHHWNTIVLSKGEFISEYNKNKNALKKFNNNIDFFAFPNGQFGTCFSKQQLEILDTTSAIKYFSSDSCFNTDNCQKLLGRISLINTDTCIFDFWYRLGRSFHK